MLSTKIADFDHGIFVAVYPTYFYGLLAPIFRMKNSFPPIVLEALEGISDVKGENTVVLDLRELDNAVCDYFIITEAQSSTQVSALSGSVEKRLREQCDERPWHIEGSQESEWILMDYVHVVVHIFQREARTFYDIEGLWGDATYTAIPS